MPTTIEQENVIAALRTPQPWPAGTARVDVIETHAALVFLAGDQALKIKRAVKLPYLNFSTLELRRRVCEREFALNAPQAPDIYQGVVAIKQLPNGTIRIGGETGVTVEWGLRMRRFEQDLLMSEMVRRGSLTPDIIKALADRVIAYHKAAPTEVPGVDRLPSVMRELLAALTGSTDAAIRRSVDELALLFAHVTAESSAVRLERAESGFIRRCHGDLHLKNIVLWRGKPVLFDALEFDEMLATADTLYDLAFLLMDLDRHDARAQANQLLNRYLWRSGDPLDLSGLAALPLFLGLRACIRARVALDRSTVTNTNGAERTHALETLARAATYLRPTPASLIAIGGLSGSGKTTLAAALAPWIGPVPGALHLRTDLERKWLAGVDEFDRLPPQAYSDKSTRATYERVERRAEEALAAGHSVIVDGVFSAQAERTALEAIATKADVPFRGLWLDAPPPVLLRRVEARSEDASDATAAIVERQIAHAPRVADWTHIDANGTVEEVVTRARRALRPFDARYGS